MRILLFVLVLCMIAQSQVLLNETFSNFFPDSTPSYAFYPMDNTTYPPNSISDRSGNGKTLTIGAATAGQKQASILVDGGYSEDFNASGSFFRHDDSYWNVLATSGFSFVIAVRFESLTGSLWMFSRDDGSSNRQMGFLTNGTQARFYCYQAAGEFRRPSSSLATDTWYVFVGIFDTTGTGAINLYRNGVASAEAVSGTINDTLRTPTLVALGVSGISNGTLDMNADVSLLALYRGALTTKQVKEAGYLANGWRSLNGNVTRSSFAFHQGIVADTIYHATTLTAGSWSVTVNVDGAAGGESLSVLTSADASTWNTIGTISATTTATDYTVTGTGLGYIGFGLAAGTVYIDNLTVTLSSGSSKPGYAGYKGWRQQKFHKKHKSF